MLNCGVEIEQIAPELAILQKEQTKSKTVDLEKKVENENSVEKKLEEIAKKVERAEQEDKLNLAKEENGFIAYADKNSFSKTYNSCAEGFYEPASKDYYSSLMGEQESQFTYASQPEINEQKNEQQAEKSQYLSKESMIFGAQITTKGSMSRDEQTVLASSSVRAETLYMFKILNPGWWKCLYELRTTPAEFN